MKKIIKKIMILTLATICSVSVVFGFSDLTNEHWAYDQIQKMTEKGVISGYLDGTFKPEKEITREEFATILTKALNLPEKDGLVEFKDIENDRWSKKYIDATSEYLTVYVEKGEYYFRPMAPAVREDMAVAIVKAKGLEYQTPDYSVLNKFSDADSISDNLRKYVAIAVQNKIMNGNTNGTFNPLGNLTRAELTALINNVYVNEELGDKVVVGDEIEVKEEIIYGDLNNDGKVDFIDTVEMTDYLYERVSGESSSFVTKKNIEFNEKADLNNDGKVNKMDKWLLGAYVTENINKLPHECDYYTVVVEKKTDECHTITYKCACGIKQYGPGLVYHQFIDGKCECGVIEQDEEILYGDVNNDGKVTSSDLSSMPDYYNKINKNADVFVDGKIDIVDYMVLESHLINGSKIPHICNGYTVSYTKIDDATHERVYECECGMKATYANDKHEIENGKCVCGYEEKEEIIYGDVNNDGIINTTDITLLNRYIAGTYGVKLDEDVADVFADGKIDKMDVIALRGYVASGYIKELPHACGTYEISYKEVDKDTHKIIYKCKCGKLSYEETANHEMKNGKCECGAKEQNEEVSGLITLLDEKNKIIEIDGVEYKLSDDVLVGMFREAKPSYSLNVLTSVLTDGLKIKDPSKLMTRNVKVELKFDSSNKVSEINHVEYSEPVNRTFGTPEDEIIVGANNKLVNNCDAYILNGKNVDKSKIKEGMVLTFVGGAIRYGYFSSETVSGRLESYSSTTNSMIIDGEEFKVTSKPYYKKQSGYIQVNNANELNKLYNGQEVEALLNFTGEVTAIISKEQNKEIIYGDVNNDGITNTTDITLLNRYIAGTYGVKLDEDVADVFADGKIDKMDVIALRGYVTSGYIKELPHACGTYEISYEEVDKDTHKISYKCKCGKLSYEETAKHEMKNGKCVCGYEEKEDILYGDVNNDGKVNNKDVTRLQQYLSGKNVTINKETADVFVDGKIDKMDFAMLMTYMANWDTELPHLCGTYDVIYEELSNGKHKIQFNCRCGVLSLPLEEEHIVNNGKCECGYVKEYNSEYLEEAIDDVVDLEIMDINKYDNKELDEIVTKEEMALYVGKLVGMTTNDMDEIYNRLEKKEIIPIDLNGGTYNENEKVTQAEAATMIVRALGWGEVVEQIGEWPSNYITKASELRLFKNMVGTNNELVTKGNIATLIHNALDAKRWEVIESSDGKLTSSKNPATLRELYF